jgi:hypothetical protein
MPKSDKTDLLDNQPPKPWREVWPVAEELTELGFPRRESEARKAAALDMKLRGINRPILYFNDPVFGDCLIDSDGVDRLIIAEEENLFVVSKYSVRGREPRYVLQIRVDDGESGPVLREIPFLCLREETDVYAAIAEVNLSSKLPVDRTQWRRIRSIYVIENHQKSDRQIAGELSIDHKTVAAVRAEAVQLGKIPQLETRLGTDGKVRRLPFIRPATQKALDADEERWEAEEAARLKAEEEEKAKREAEEAEKAERVAAEERVAKEAEAKREGESKQKAEEAEVKQEAAEREAKPKRKAEETGADRPPIGSAESEKRLEPTASPPLTPTKALALSKSALTLAELIRQTPEPELAAQLATIDGADREKFLRALPCAWWDRIRGNGKADTVTNNASDLLRRALDNARHLNGRSDGAIADDMRALRAQLGAAGVNHHQVAIRIIGGLLREQA